VVKQVIVAKQVIVVEQIMTGGTFIGGELT
jgi:hypothetical protein